MEDGKFWLNLSPERIYAESSKTKSFPIDFILNFPIFVRRYPNKCYALFVPSTK